MFNAAVTVTVVMFPFTVKLKHPDALFFLLDKYHSEQLTVGYRFNPQSLGFPKIPEVSLCPQTLALYGSES